MVREGEAPQPELAAAVASLAAAVDGLRRWLETDADDALAAAREQAANAIRALAASGHFRLVETLADRIASLLTKDFGAPWVKVTVAKIGILPNAKFVGVSIERGKR